MLPIRNRERGFPVPHHKYSYTPTLVNEPFDPEKAHLKYLAATRGFTSSAWKLLETLGTLEGYEPQPHHVAIFLDAVSRCKTALERSTLLVLGQGVFRFDPCEAFDAVETTMLERMQGLDAQASS